MKSKSSSGVGKGLIQKGGDTHGYLGHFRNAQTMKRGHNQGAPGGNDQMAGAAPPRVVDDAGMNPISNPGGFHASTGIQPPKPAPGGAAARAADVLGRSKVATAQKSMLGAKTTPEWQTAKAQVQEAKGERKAAFKDLKQSQAALAAKGYGGGRGKAVKAAKENLRENFAGAFKNYRAEQKRKREAAEGGGLFSKIGKAFGVGEAKKAFGGMKKAAGGMMKKGGGAMKKIGRGGM